MGIKVCLLQIGYDLELQYKALRTFIPNDITFECIHLLYLSSHPNTFTPNCCALSLTDSLKCTTSVACSMIVKASNIFSNCNCNSDVGSFKIDDNSSSSNLRLDILLKNGVSSVVLSE